MNTSECREVQERIIADLDEGLVEDEREILEVHLRQCDSCRRMRDETARLFSALKDDVPPDPDEKFWRELETSLDAKILRTDLRGRFGNRWKPVALALAAGLAFFAVWAGYFDPFGGRTSTDEAALPAVIEELERAYGPSSGEGEGTQVSSDTTLSAADGLALRADTVAEWFATEYDPLMLWL